MVCFIGFSLFGAGGKSHAAPNGKLQLAPGTRPTQADTVSPKLAMQVGDFLGKWLMVRPTNSMNSTKLVTKSGSGPSKMVIGLRLSSLLINRHLGAIIILFPFGRVLPLEHGIAQMDSVQNLHAGWYIENPEMHDDMYIVC